MADGWGDKTYSVQHGRTVQVWFLLCIVVTKGDVETYLYFRFNISNVRICLRWTKPRWGKKWGFKTEIEIELILLLHHHHHHHLLLLHLVVDVVPLIFLLLKTSLRLNTILGVIYHLSQSGIVVPPLSRNIWMSLAGKSSETWKYLIHWLLLKDWNVWLIKSVTWPIKSNILICIRSSDEADKNRTTTRVFHPYTILPPLTYRRIWYPVTPGSDWNF